MKGPQTFLIFLALTWLFCSCGRSKIDKTSETTNELKNDSSVQPTKQFMGDTTFVDQIEKLGYFKYADEDLIDSLKKAMLKEFDRSAGLPLLYSLNPLECLDYRHYTCDGESVYESGGIPDIISEMKPGLDRMGLKFEVDDYFEEWDEKNGWLNESITVNGTKYSIFKNYKEAGWAEAPYRLAQILNTEFERQRIDERVYLILGGNEGSLIILSKALFKYIDSIMTIDSDKPMRLNDWAKQQRMTNLNFY